MIPLFPSLSLSLSQRTSLRHRPPSHASLSFSSFQSTFYLKTYFHVSLYHTHRHNLLPTTDCFRLNISLSLSLAPSLHQTLSRPSFFPRCWAKYLNLGARYRLVASTTRFFDRSSLLATRSPTRRSAPFLPKLPHLPLKRGRRGGGGD